MTAWYHAKVSDASDRTYASMVMPLLEKAQKEIALSFYLIETSDQAGPAHPVNRMAEALFAAARRGVRVRIVLNSNFRFVPKTDIAKGQYFAKLLDAKVELTVLIPGRRLHDKLMVIDSRYVVEGSMNWSVAALQSNFESVTLIDSPRYAAQKLERINRLCRPQPISERDSDTPLAPVPDLVEFPGPLMSRNYFGRMINTSDMRAFDICLILLGQARARGTADLMIDLETLGRKLKLPQTMARSAVRRQMIKTLKKLQSRYKLITAEFPFGANARITLKEPAGEKIWIPGSLLEADELAATTSGATALALAGEILKQEGIDCRRLSAPELERRFGIGRSAWVRARREHGINQ